MRLWSVHPCYLDAKGLVALWREGLLAQKVLLGETRGYRRHPQLDRFRSTADPAGTVGRFLWHVMQEATQRGYRFSGERIRSVGPELTLPVTTGQLHYEFRHLLEKLRVRDPGRWQQLAAIEDISPHPLFTPVEGLVEPWEKTVETARTSG